MMPQPFKQSAGWAVLLLLALFLAEGSAWSAPSTSSDPQKSLNNSVTAPSPSKPGKPIPGPSTNASGKINLNNRANATPNGTPSAHPLTLSTGPKGDIRDIRGPIHIPDPTLWLFYALGGILMLLLAWAAWKWFGKRKAFHAKTAFEIAFEELERAKALMTPEKAERFSVMVSSTVRTYIEKRFSLRATRKTTHEFMILVAAEPSSELKQHEESLQEFLAHCDLAKFARQTFHVEQMQKMHRSAWRFVEETMPQPHEKKAEKSASTVKDKVMATEDGKNGIKGKSRFFKGRLKGVQFHKKDTGNQGFRNTRQAAAVGGR
ncbi:MAG: hypothetical protein LJE96_06290 [Deltaproteobacteria bacterium]|jgi:hypothetical protein|nr:hypothetical protein [Deltaproteobacteria bacterium]